MSRHNIQRAIPKQWGREIILVDDAYCVKLLQYDGVRTSSEHYHERKHETFVVIRGEFEITWWHINTPHERSRGRFPIGKSLVLPPLTVHQVKCVSPDGGTLFEASSHEDPDDCVRISPSVNPCG